MVNRYLIQSHIIVYLQGLFRSIVTFPQAFENGWKVLILFFHLLMMTTTLFCLSGANELFHSFEDFIGSSEMALDKMFVVNLKEPMIQFVFLN